MSIIEQKCKKRCEAYRPKKGLQKFCLSQKKFMGLKIIQMLTSFIKSDRSR